MIDPERLDQWFNACEHALVLYAQQWLSREAAEDIVQEVFLRLLGKLRVPAHVKPWLFRSVRNAAMNELRSGRRRRKREHERARSSTEWFEDRSEDLIDAATAQAALESVSDGQREIIVMRIWGGLTLSEASKATGEPVSTLFSRYTTGMAALRKALEVSCDPKKP